MLNVDMVLSGRYQIVRKLGHGGMGAVYLAIDQRLGNTVALKETLVEGEQYRRAFEREARLLSRLRHPALPVVIDYFAQDGTDFLVMQYIPGEDLQELLDRNNRPFELELVLSWADTLLDALEYLHGHNPPIIHRDIKPQNLKLTPKGEIVLLDFGLSKGPVESVARATSNQSLYGYTLSYAPLEQVQGSGTDPRSDLYSLAATMYHLLTGFYPADAMMRGMAMLSHRPDPLKAADTLNPHLPEAVAGVLHNTLSQEAEHRPASAAAMRQALRSAWRDSRGLAPMGLPAGGASVQTAISTPDLSAMQALMNLAPPSVSSGASLAPPISGAGVHSGPGAGAGAGAYSGPGAGAYSGGGSVANPVPGAGAYSGGGSAVNPVPGAGAYSGAGAHSGPDSGAYSGPGAAGLSQPGQTGGSSTPQTLNPRPPAARVGFAGKVLLAVLGPSVGAIAAFLVLKGSFGPPSSATGNADIPVQVASSGPRQPDSGGPAQPGSSGPTPPGSSGPLVPSQPVIGVVSPTPAPTMASQAAPLTAPGPAVTAPPPGPSGQPGPGQAPNPGAIALAPERPRPPVQTIPPGAPAPASDPIPVTAVASIPSRPISAPPPESGIPAPVAGSKRPAGIVGGQNINWTQQGISWVVPARWTEGSIDSRMFFYRSPGTVEIGSLIVNISPMPESFPVDMSLKAYYDHGKQQVSWGEMSEVKYLELDGVKGVLMRESTPENPDNPQRILWEAYRVHNGQMQLVNLIMAARGRDFPTHRETFDAILATTRLAK